MNNKHYGLHIDGVGNVTLAKRPYKGFGINYFAAFAGYWDKPLDEDSFRDAFESIKTYGIDYIRMPFCGYGADYFKHYDKDPDDVFAHLDRIVAEAERLHLGIIADLIWYDAAIAEHVGGKRADMGEAESAVTLYSLDYVKAIVSRYADSPAIWGWEIGNEYNLDADLCDGRNWSWLPEYVTRPTGYDYFTSEEMVSYFTRLAEAVRGIDPWRMISTGHCEMRSCAASLAAASDMANPLTHIWNTRWDEQPRDDFDRMTAYMTPAPCDTVSFHLQHGTSDGSEQFIEKFDRFGDTLSQREYLTAYAETAKSLKRGVFMGEMGDYLDLSGESVTADHFRTLCEDIIESGIPIACAWLFKSFNELNMNGAFMSIMGQFNDALRDQGIDAERAWPKEKKEKDKKKPDKNASDTEEKPKKKSKKKHRGLKTAAAIATVAAVSIVAAGSAKSKKRR